MRKGSSFSVAIALAAVVLLSGTAMAVDYTSVVNNGSWGAGATWSPTGIPTAADNAFLNTNVIKNAGSPQYQVNDVTINPNCTLKTTATDTLFVFGNWTNNGRAKLDSGTVSFTGTSGATIGGSTATAFYRLQVNKNALSTTVILGQAISVTAFNDYTNPVLAVQRGTMSTNGADLTVNAGTYAAVSGGISGKLDINGASVVNIRSLYQRYGPHDLGLVSVSGTATLNITADHQLWNNGHRFEVSGGTVNYTSYDYWGYNLNMATLNGGGIFATGGVITFNGNINASYSSCVFQATGTAVVKFVGNRSTFVNFYNQSSTPGNAWDFNDLRIEKTGDSTVTFYSGALPAMTRSVTADTGLTVNPGAGLILQGNFASGFGYQFGNVNNQGKITQGVDLVKVTGNWTGNGILNGNRTITFTGAGAKTVATTTPFYDIVINKNGGSLALGAALSVTHSLNIAAGTFAVEDKTLTLGTITTPGTMTAAAGTFSAVGSAFASGTITAANSVYPFSFDIDSGATIAAQYAVFQGMDADGVNVADGAVVDASDNFSNCTFNSARPSRPMLKVENAESIAMTNVSFLGTRGYNIEKSADQGFISVTGGSGPRWGPVYEQDPNSRVDWFGPDVGALSIDFPSGSLDTSVSVTPSATCKNYSTVYTSTFKAFLRLRDNLGATVYLDSFTVTGLAPNSPISHDFGSWPGPHAPGSYSVRCSTSMATDFNHANDTLSQSFVITASDAGVSAIHAPAGSRDTGEVIVPSATFKNFSTLSTSSFKAFFLVQDELAATVYADSFLVSGLAPEGTVRHDFSVWPKPHAEGDYVSRCSTWIADDNNSGNDVLTEPFRVAVPHPDAGVDVVFAPTGTLDSAAAVLPRARFVNNGPGDATFRVFFRIDSGATHVAFYNEDSLVNGLAEHGTVTIEFPEWAKPHPFGAYAFVCSTGLAADTHNVNDAVHGSFTVSYGGAGFWVAREALPPGGKSKNVKDGGALAYGKEGTDANDTGYVYAFKGNNRYEFYRYNTLSNVWVSRESIPAVNRLMKKKAVKKGSTLVMATDGKIYAAKGNNTLDWWQYDPSARTWIQKADVPTGAKNLKEGVGSAAVKIGSDNYVYLLRGSGTYDFYRYNTATDVWDITLPTAPGGVSTKPYKNGSSLTYDGNDTIYCLKGSYNEFAAYSISGKTWVTKDPLPLVAPPSTKKKKVKDGSQIAYAGSVVYALKGGNTDEFWFYPADSHRWIHGTDLTVGAKRVKGGGALTYSEGDSRLYAFRGNNTREFWQYGPIGTFSYPLAAGSQPKNVQGQSAVHTSQFALRIAPNPFTTTTSISYSLPNPGDVSLKLYDITGKLVSTLAGGYHPAGNYACRLPRTAHRLSAGVYLLKFETEGYSATEKLIIE